MATACNPVEIIFPSCEGDTVDTLAALRLYAGRPEEITVLGGVSVGDGIGGTYVWVAGSLTADDGADVIRPSSLTHLQAGRWKRLSARRSSVVTTYDAAPALILPANTAMLDISGKAVAGDFGDAAYRAVATEPAHSGKIQVGGQWFEMMGAFANPDAFTRTGDADDTAAIQRAVDYCASRSLAAVQFNARGYNMSAATLVLPSAVQLIGQGFTESGVTNAQSPATGFGEQVRGTFIKVNCLGRPGISVNNPNARGARIDRIMFTQDHPTVGSGAWMPTPYDFLISNRGSLGGLEIGDVMALGINKVLDNSLAGRLTIGRMRGQWFTMGIRIDRSLDLVTIDKIHQWPFVTGNKKVLDYQVKNLVVLEVGRADGIHIESLFSFAGYSTLHLTRLEEVGPPTDIKVTNLYSDASQYGVVVDAPGAIASFATMTAQGEDLVTGGGVALAGSIGLYLNPEANGSSVTVGVHRYERMGTAGVSNASNATVSMTGTGLMRYYTGADIYLSPVTKINLHQQPITDLSGNAVKEGDVRRWLTN